MRNSKVKGILLFLLFLLLLVLALAPCLFLVVFPDMKKSTDVLGYYGSLLGGAITIIGIFATFRYERKQSEEDRRNESLPILRFTFEPIYCDVSENGQNVSLEQRFETIHFEKSDVDKNNKYFQDYEIIIDTTKEDKPLEAKEPNPVKILEYGSLKIENIGLKAAVLSNIYLKRETYPRTIKNLAQIKLDRFVVAPGNKIVLNMVIKSNNLQGDDFLVVEFFDIYLNRYYYKMSFDEFQIEDDNENVKIEYVNENVKIEDDNENVKYVYRIHPNNVRSLPSKLK